MMSNPELTVPTADERRAAVKEFFDQQRQIRRERTLATEAAQIALPMLVEACHGKTNQAYHLRALLFSLWNGQPVNLSDKLKLDWELQKAFCTVVLAFGSEAFFYDEISAAFKEVGLFEWFIAEGEL